MQPILPNDILFLIADNVDQVTLYQLAFTCKSLSRYALRLLWSQPYFSTCSGLLKWVDTLSNQTSINDYQQWITGLAIHIDCDEQPFPFNIFPILKQLELKVISFQYLSTSTSDTATVEEIQFMEFICAQLDQSVAEIYLYNCSTRVVNSIFRSIKDTTRNMLTTLSIYECPLITDNQIAEVARYCPNLRSLQLMKSGYFSDLGLTYVAQYCHDLNKLIVTLPSNIIQSNTITMDTINALKTNCHRLQKFICPGQIRIANYLLECDNDLTNGV